MGQPRSAGASIALLLAVAIFPVEHVVSQGLPRELTVWNFAPSFNLLSADGSTISLPGYSAAGWWDAQVPCTIFACLMQGGLFSDIFFGQNIFTVNTSQFNTSWWYRTTFPVVADGRVTLVFHGINYRANVWINGVNVANNNSIVGTFRYFELDITDVAVSGSTNALAVEVFPQHDRALPSTNHDTDLGISFVDWAPTPPDNNMGLWRSVWLYTAGPLTVRYPSVNSTVSTTPETATANITISALLTNLDQISHNAVIEASIVSPDGQEIGSITQQIAIDAQAKLLVTFDSQHYSALLIKSAMLWWPWQMGQPNMYTLNLRAYVIASGGQQQLSDNSSSRFGVRQITSTLDQNGYRLYSVNGKTILIRGAGWSPDLFLRHNTSSLAAQLQYVRGMNLNTLRLEGKMEPDEFFEQCDELGLLVMVGWCCCDAWQHWQYWGAEQYSVAAESMRSQLQRLRIHPSILVFMLSSDELPPANVEQMYLQVATEEVWPNPTVSAAAQYVSNITGSTGVKMSGPYSWEPPNYWLEDTGSIGLGGAWGFLTEGGPGENPMPVESLTATVPEADIWPPAPTDCWGHCANPQGLFRTLLRFNWPLFARYGTPTSVMQYNLQAQAQAYESHRAMFEGYSRQKYTTATGVIHWMLNNAWPGNVWHLYDFYLTPSASYFATKKACEPLHIQYSYDDATVWVVNSLYNHSESTVATARVLAWNGTVLFQASTTVASMGGDSAWQILQLPDQKMMASLAGQNSSTFVRLQLLSSSTNTTLSTNDYWLSTKPDVLQWDNSSFYYTPCTAFADFSALRQLMPVFLQVQQQQLSTNITSVTVTNPHTDRIAFMIRLRLLAPSGADIAPIFWDDNYFSLLPLEVRTVSATYDTTFSPGQALVVEVWNNLAGGA